MPVLSMRSARGPRDRRRARPRSTGSCPLIRIGLVVALALPGSLGCPRLDCPEPGDVVPLVDAANFHYELDVDVESEELAASEDATISWGSLTRDLLGHVMDPVEGVDGAVLLVLDGVEPRAAAIAIATDTLDQSTVTAVFVCEPEGTSCLLSEFAFFGTGIDVEDLFAEGSRVWLLSVRSESEPPYREFKKLLYVDPSDSSDRHEATFDDDSSLFEVEADLSSLEPVLLPEGGTGIVDWSGVTLNGHGDAFDRSRVDTLWMAWFAGASPAGLEAQMVDLEVIGDGYWQMDVEGTTRADLAELVPIDENGSPFHGVDSSGTWLLGLRCSSCRSPMPHFLTVLSTTCQ